MSWKKNVFSCLMWVVYLLIVGTAMIFTGRVICDSFEMAEYFGVIIPAVYLLFAGILVFGLHRMAVRLGVSPHGAGKGLAWIERILVLVLFAAGLFLRVTQLQAESFTISDESVYLKSAYISADGQEIPQFSHGAVYMYIRVLRLCFMLLGNKGAAAVWLQIIMQMLGVLLLYLAVRKMAGRIPAVMMSAFFMLSTYMVGKSLVVSPEMLYLLVFSLVLLYVSQGVKYVFGGGFWLAAGVLTAVLTYLDAAGVLLLPLLPGVICMRRQEAGRKAVSGICGSLAGFLAGAAGCVFADAVASGKPVSGIIRAWTELYRWGDLQLSVTLSGFGMVWMIILLLCFMAWGIFGYWCSKGTDRFAVWTFCLSVTVLLQCLGIFTEEMSGFVHIFFFSTVLAGLGVRESMTFCPADGFAEEMADEYGTEPGEGQDRFERDETTESGEEQGQIMAGGMTEAGEERGQSMADGTTEAGEERGQIMADGMTEPGEGQGQSVADGKLQDGKLRDRNSDAADMARIVGEEKGTVERKGNTEVRDRIEGKGSAETRNIAEGKGSAETRNIAEGKGSAETRNIAEIEDNTETGDNTGSWSHAEKKPAETAGNETKGAEGKPERKIEFLENPLPLPKKHEKRVMDYRLKDGGELGGYDFDVADDDDFDI